MHLHHERNALVAQKNLRFDWLTDGAPVQIKINNSLTEIMKLERVVVDSFCYKVMNTQYKDMPCLG